MQGHLEHARVLVIDDDAPMSRMIAMTLRSSGYDVSIASNGERGLEQVEAEHPDIIVLDLKMPVMDGHAFYRELRQRGFDMPVMIVSAHGARQAQRELDAQAAINKPFSPDALSDKVEELLTAAGH
ncbi:MAG: response regulator [Dehalococcoidia bacterium]